jgi:hypothetical protein
MRINFKRNSGSVFIVIMVLTGVLGVTLASYLHMVSNQNISIMRSMAWNEAVAVSEAGIEEAMAHLNRNRTNRTRDGWALHGTNSNWVVKEKTIGRQKYRTFVEANAEFPKIISEGYVVHPQTGAWLPSPRTVRVSTTNDAIFAKGLVAKGNIDLSGNGIASDSYDSLNPSYSTGGMYDPAKRRDKGDIATNSSIDDSLNVWNAEIYGKVSTGPGGNVRIHNGTVGSIAHHASGVGGIEPGYTTDDMNVYFPDVDHPGGGFSPAVGLPAAWVSGPYVINGVPTVYNYIVPGGQYQLKSGLNLNNKSMVITSPTVLLVDGDISISGGSGGITIAPGASLQIFMTGATTTISGQGIMNRAGRPANFSYWGLPSNTLVRLQGNGDFIGTIYAPQAALVMGGGGSSGDDFMGAAVAGSVKMGGHYKVHYDESLLPFGQRRGYTIVTWNEVVPGTL